MALVVLGDAYGPVLVDVEGGTRCDDDPSREVALDLVLVQDVGHHFDTGHERSDTGCEIGGYHEGSVVELDPRKLGVLQDEVQRSGIAGPSHDVVSGAILKGDGI